MSELFKTGDQVSELFKTGDQVQVKDSITLPFCKPKTAYTIDRPLGFSNTVNSYSYRLEGVPARVYEFEIEPAAADTPRAKLITKRGKRAPFQKPCRNFWIEAEIDNPRGGKQILAGGPAGKDGGFTLKIKMRDEGEYVETFKITGAVQDGGLYLHVIAPDGSISDAKSTLRDKPKGKS